MEVYNRENKLFCKMEILELRNIIVEIKMPCIGSTAEADKDSMSSSKEQKLKRLLGN